MVELFQKHTADSHKVSFFFGSLLVEHVGSLLVEHGAKYWAITKHAQVLVQF